MPRDAITGAFGFSGRHIAARVLARGRDVVTLTNHPHRPDPFEGRVHVRPLDFDNAAGLAESLRGVDTLYNTYWMRLERRGVTFVDAARNSEALFRAAGSAGVRRIVHLSVANADRAPHLPYYRGKAQVEEALRASGIGHAILRPAVLMGDQPMLINSIAWMLRHLPAFGIPGDGRYRIQPIHVDDLALLATELADADGDVTIDAAGPEQFTFAEFLERIRNAVGSRALLMRVPPGAALLAGRGLGLLLRDVVITREELVGLTENLLASNEPPRGTTRFTDWLAGSAPWLGRRYLSELRRHAA